jgi:hypothetical protein
VTGRDAKLDAPRRIARGTPRSRAIQPHLILRQVLQLSFIYLISFDEKMGQTHSLHLLSDSKQLFKHRIPLYAMSARFCEYNRQIAYILQQSDVAYSSFTLCSLPLRFVLEPNSYFSLSQAVLATRSTISPMSLTSDTCDHPPDLKPYPKLDLASRLGSFFPFLHKVTKKALSH